MKRKINLPDVLIYLYIAIFSIICFLPMILTAIISFTDETAIRKNGYSFFPEEWSINAYRMIFHAESTILRSYVLTVVITIVGTVLAVLITAAAAYTLANKRVRYSNAIAVFFFITMVFTAGIVPWYLICRTIGLYNNVLALIIPSLLFNPFNLFLVRNYMKGLPDSLQESAMLDGANDFTIFTKIYLPLSVPVIATISLFYGLGYWNNWWNAIMLIDDQHLYPLQYYMLMIKSQFNMANELAAITGDNNVIAPTESLKMATAIVTIGPIVLLYPYLQKYFIKGLVIGSIKG